MIAAPTPTPMNSASAISLFRECPRKWGLKYLAFVEAPQKTFAALGDEVDAGQLQPLLRDGRPLQFTNEDGAPKPSGYIAASALEHLPPPKTPGLELQRWFRVPSPQIDERGFARWGYHGAQDLWLPDSSVMPNVLPAPPGVVVPCVGDFKTTKDFKWRKKEDALRVDVQANLYALETMFTTRARVVDLVWIYMRTDPKKAWKSERTYVRVDAQHVVGQFREIEKTAAEMHAHRKACAATNDAEAYALTLTPNAEACDGFGGCEYRGTQCNLSPDQIVDALAAADRHRHLPIVTGEENMSNAPNSAFLERMARLRGGAATPAPTITTAPPVMGMSDRDVPPPTGIPAAFLPPPAPQPAPINPPESALPPAPPVGSIATVAAPAPAGAPAEAPKRRGRPPRAAATGGAASPAAEAAPPVTISTTNVGGAGGASVFGAAGGGGGAGGPSAPLPPSQTFTATGQWTPPPGVTTVVTSTGGDAAPAAEKPIATVYFDCYPVGGAFTSAEELYAEVNRAILAKHNLPDYRFGEFGKGPGIFASRLALLLDDIAKECGAPIGDVVCDTRTPEGSIAKSVFAARAERVVQGTR